MIMSGWIKIHRKIQNHPFYSERRAFSRLEAWIDLLLLANHKDHKFLLGSQMIEAQRGEVITSELKLMERWRWSKAKVRRYIACLVDEKMVIKKATRKKTSLFIVNFKSYQKRETTKKPQKNYEETTDDTQSRMNKNEESLRDSKKPNPAIKQFIDFWNQEFQKKTGSAYHVNGGKEGSLTKSLLKTYSLVRLKELAGVFFTSKDPFILSAGHTIGVFHSQINKLATEGERKSSW